MALQSRPANRFARIATTLLLAAVAVGATADRDALASAPVEVARILTDSLFGRSGKLRARLLAPSRPLAIATLQRLFGDSTEVAAPGIRTVHDSAAGRSLDFITLLPFHAKADGLLEGYRMGFWPGEKRPIRSAAYANPDGFIRITAENQDTWVSEHFRLRDFLTHDQQHVWPKYLVLSLIHI